MRQKPWSPYELLYTLIGTREIPGVQNNPLIMAMLQSDQSWPADDETAWCSAAVNFACKLTATERTKKLSARSWLKIGEPILVTAAEPGFDVCIFQRGEGPQPGPDVIDAPGHVAFFHALEGDFIACLGGNQGNQVSIARIHRAKLLGVRRLAGN